jgi:dCMP deaminase
MRPFVLAHKNRRPPPSPKWDARFFDLASHVAEWSKDPSTRCGCVIVRPDRTIASVGYNGPPRGVSDAYGTREEKLARTIHAEENAILTASGVRGCTLYVYPMQPCAHCAAVIVQAGIVRVVSMRPSVDKAERWADSFNHAAAMFREAGVTLDILGECRD